MIIEPTCLADARAAYKVASEAADRFRDVLCEVLGHDAENPGDDVLVSEIRARFGKSGSEPTAWRDRLVGYVAHIEQVNAARQDAAGTKAQGAEEVCCDMHNQHCEPPGDLCCHACTEAAHDTFPIRHADGSRCVLETS